MSDSFSIRGLIYMEYCDTQFPLKDTALPSISSQWKLIEKNKSKTIIFLT